MKRRITSIVVVYSIVSLACGASVAQTVPAGEAPGGIAIHLGSADIETLKDLHAEGRFTVQVLDRDAKRVADLRKRISTAGIYGSVSARAFSGDRLPYVNDLIHMVVADETMGISEEEILRVLCPFGEARIRSGKMWRTLVKPWPDDIDEWTHFLHNGLATTTVPISAFADEKKKSNFLFILIDDMGWADVGFNGHTVFYETPNLDKLASSGMKFTDAYASCPVCSPTRASILTGRHPVRVDITDWIPGHSMRNSRLEHVHDRSSLALEEVTIAEALKESGYTTFFAGKWHLGKEERFYPEQQGFDINKGGHGRGSPPGGYYTPYKNPKLSDGSEGEYLTDRLATESCNFLESAKNKPFLLYLSFYTVHTPIQACQRHIAKFQETSALLPEADQTTRKEHDAVTKIVQDNPAYASMIYAMDENVGRILDKIEELGLSDNTVVIFTSDNGGLSTKKAGTPTSNEPLRAGKGWCYEGGIRVPMIIRAPGVTKKGTTCNVPVTSTDFFPTMLELAGMPLQPNLHVDGLSLVPLLKGEKSLPRKAIHWHYPHYHGSLWRPGAAIRAGDWKLIEFYDPPAVELYNLANDLSEKNDLSTKEPELTIEILAMLHSWQKELGAKIPKANPNYNPEGEPKSNKAPQKRERGKKVKLFKHMKQ